MKRATTINISGQLFSIDEDAEKALKLYLDQLERELADEPDNTEMLSDIEASVADHLREQAPTASDPVTIAMVEQVKSTIGHITDEKEDKTGKSTPKGTSWDELMSQPIYKSRHNKVIDGVCAGLGERFGIDPLWFRLAFLSLVWLTHGFMILVYIALAIVLKEDPSDKSMRQKRKLTANAVVEQVKDQAKQVKQAADEKDAGRTVGRIIKQTGIIFAKIARVAVSGFIAWIMILVTAVFAYAAVNLLEPGKDVPFIGTSRGGIFWVLVIAGYFTIILPLIMLVISMFSRRRAGLNWFSVSTFLVWLVAASLAGSVIAVKHQEFGNWAHTHRDSEWVDNGFVRINASDQYDPDFTCVSLIGSCDEPSVMSR